MKMKPILFSTPMIQALLAGRKTQTRRIVKPQPKQEKGLWFYGDKHEISGKLAPDRDNLYSLYGGKYAPGNILYVRETCQHTSVLGIHPDDDNYGYVYRAEGDDWKDIEDWHWRPSIFMPREAARIFLEVTDVRVERLWDISQEDAALEGMTKDLYRSFGYSSGESEEEFYTSYARHCFIKVWESINGPDSWEINPWVWRYSFKRIEKPA